MVSARLLNLATLELETRSRIALDLGYRRSNLTATDVVLEATFRLERAAESSIRQRMDANRKHRAATQPGAVLNAGSVFKNPAGDSAGRLIDAAGLKGFRVGGASVSDVHANFFMAEEGATSQDVFDLVHAVKDVVADRFGIELEPEIRFVGEFEPYRGASARRES